MAYFPLLLENSRIYKALK